MARALDEPSLYDTDYVAWLSKQVAHLRARDIESAAEEREGLLKNERQQLGNRSVELVLHVLKWDHAPQRRSNRWRPTVQKQRSRIRRLLRDSPSLRSGVERMCRELYPEALGRAAIETELSEPAFPQTLPYAVEQIFERELPAEELPDQRPSRKKQR